MTTPTLFVLTVLIGFVLVACPASSPSKPPADAMVPPSLCDTCTAKKCSTAAAACAGDKDCKSISACVEATSPCVGARADDPLCDDDCIKAACALKYPAGVSLYAKLQQCQSAAQCSNCSMPCADAISNMKCVIGEVCNYAAPTADNCKCIGLDAGVDASMKMPTAGSSGGCSANPTCALVDASVVNLALGKNITGPKTTSHTASGQTLNLCHYDTPAGSTDVDPVDIAYSFPLDMAGFKTLRATNRGPTTDLPNLGDAAFWTQPPGPMTYGVHDVVVLVGCVQIEVGGGASVDQLVVLAKKIIAKL
jgi:hypothetical protein